MRYALTAEQKFFFSKSRYIEFENLLPEAACRQALELVEEQLRRLKVPRTRDLSRDLIMLRRLVVKQLPHSVACELLLAGPVRLAFDQFYSNLALQTGTVTLPSMSSLQPTLGGLLVRLSGTSMVEDPAWIPSQVGNASFLATDLPIDQTLLCQDAFLLVVYCGEKSLYVLNPQDPYTHDLKGLGYVFGDMVQDATHPLLAREQF